ncbi:MAG: ring-opening amidohydrolase [Alphaproteobacteria bacterium]
MRSARVHRIPTASPDDVSGLMEKIETGEIEPAGIEAILGKTEGNGCVNDFTRGFAVQALRTALAPFLDQAALDRISMVMSGGTEGGLAPHLLVFEKREVETPIEAGADASSALAIAVAHTRAMLPEEIGRRAQADAVAEAVDVAMAEAAIDRPEDVHYVQVKCPLLTAARISEAAARHESVATADSLKSMGLSRGASALGVAMALGEVSADLVTDAAIGVDMALHSARASCSAGIELMHNEIVVLGNSGAWCGDLVIGHDVMADAIDTPALYRALASIGIEASGQLSTEQRGHLIALLAKAEADPAGNIRGARHIMLDDSDIASTRHARALVGGALAGVVGHTELFISGGAEHQGPPGGGPVAVIARQKETC